MTLVACALLATSPSGDAADSRCMLDLVGKLRTIATCMAQLPSSSAQVGWVNRAQAGTHLALSAPLLWVLQAVDASAEAHVAEAAAHLFGAVNGVANKLQLSLQSTLVRQLALWPRLPGRWREQVDEVRAAAARAHVCRWVPAETPAPSSHLVVPSDTGARCGRSLARGSACD